MTFDPDPPLPPAARQPWWRRALAWRPSLGGLRAVTSLRWLPGRWAVVVLVAIPLLYFGGGALYYHKIDANPDYTGPTTAAGESRAVAMVANLITREVDIHRWTPSDPFFMPTALLDNMPNFQRGMVTALARLTVEMRDQLSRTRGSSPVDPDLEKAASLLNYQPNVFIWNPSVSIWPSATSAQQYRGARTALIAFNKRLASGEATFDRRSDNLRALLERMANDIGSTSALIDRQITEHGGDILDFHADDVFYTAKGQLYVYYMVLREVGVDFQNVQRERDLATAWQRLLATFRTAATLQPWIVSNGAPDSQLLPSHLAAQGFYLLRARTQLREMVDILQK